MGSKSLVNKPVNVTVIKKEATDFDMKDYATNTVKEVLGWYGYDGRDGGGSSSDTEEEAETPRSSSPKREHPKEVSHSPIQSIPAGFMCCSWCQKVGSAKQFSLKTPSGNKAFCSEQCFTQSRRANFKRNKTCDWCRHIRHTVNYVDFQDGEHQLQFCSDKCLNQYKMNIFCTETQAHLDVHPHPQEASTSEEVEGPTEATTTLITPDLWMRDCRSQSPDTDKSGTPPRIPSPLVEIKMSPSRSRFHPQKNVGEIGGRRKSKRSPKRSVLMEQRQSYSPPSPGGSPPGNINMNMNMRVPPTNFHPAMFPEAQRPVFFSPAILSSPPLQDARFAQRHLRKMVPQMPPLLPLGPPRPPIFPAVFPSIVPPPVTFVPYPLLLPIPIPIPIPIPLPGLKMSDLVAQLDAKKSDDSSKKPSKSDTSDAIKQENTTQPENQPSNQTSNQPPNNQTGSQKHPSPPRKRKHVVELQENDGAKKSKTVNS